MQKEAAHRRSTRPEDLRDFTLMLSNFGTLAGRYGIPLVVPPAVAILGRRQSARRCRRRRRRRTGAPAHAAVLELRSPMHHGRRGVPLPGLCHHRFGKAGLTKGSSPCIRLPQNSIAGSCPPSRGPGQAAQIPAQCGLAALSTGVLRQRRCGRPRRARTGGARRHRPVALDVRASAAKTALVRVFNPTLREHGFISPHTVIEMVNDDMPFLVDSISLALTQRALTLHFWRIPFLR